jgi:short-subunit dehydrogenase
MSNSKVVLITGCSSGIGFETAVEFVKNEHITCSTMRDLSKKEELEKEIGDSENIFQLDVTDDSSIDTTIAKIIEKHGTIDILVNNAGYGLFGSFEDTSIEEFKEQMDADFFGAVRLIKKIIPIMKKNKSGKIINISSVAGRVGFPILSSYVTSKFALEGLTESLRYELKRFGIQLSLIEPGAVNTKFFKNKILSKNALTNPDYKESVEKFIKVSEEIFNTPNIISANTVAKKIIEISNSETIKPRYVIGQDGEQIIMQRKSLPSEEFEKFMYEQMINDLM